MKKVVLLAAIALGIVSANAQVSVLGSKPTDNISITLKGGAVQNLQSPHGAFFGNMRGVVGVEIAKQLTPSFGLAVEAEGFVNKFGLDFSGPKNVFDMCYLGLQGKFNLNNIIAGYAGAPRLFEVEAFYGGGWLHGFMPYEQSLRLGVHEKDFSSFASKLGLNLNFNLGEAKAWTVGLKPAIIYAHRSPLPKYDSRLALLELEAGITYHFKNSNGKHHFVIVRPYDQAELDALNAQINDLRAAIDKTKADLDECLKNPKEMEKVVYKEVEKVVIKDNTGSVRYVHFKQGKSIVTADQMPNVEQVAVFMKSHPAAKVDIKGYASPEGSAEINKKLADDRAKAVADLLKNKYKIAADRISYKGLGVGEVFDQPEWNRVSICTLDKADK